MRSMCCFFAEVVELVDTHVSGACVRKDMGVRVPPSAQKKRTAFTVLFFCASGRREDYPAIQLSIKRKKKNNYGCSFFLLNMRLKKRFSKAQKNLNCPKIKP